MKILLLLIAMLQYNYSAVPLKPISAQEWKDDIDFFATQLVKKHKNPFHTTSQEVFEQSIIDLKNVAGSVPDYEMIVKLLQITASVGDGHTGVHLPTTFRRYPIGVYWFNKDLY